MKQGCIFFFVSPSNPSINSSKLRATWATHFHLGDLDGNRCWEIVGRLSSQLWCPRCWLSCVSSYVLFPYCLYSPSLFYLQLSQNDDFSHWQNDSIDGYVMRSKIHNNSFPFHGHTSKNEVLLTHWLCHIVFVFWIYNIWCISAWRISSSFHSFNLLGSSHSTHSKRLASA